MSISEPITCQSNPWTNLKALFFEIKDSSEWPNSKTACALLSTITNIACEIMKKSFFFTLCCNVPIRIFSIIIHRKDSYKTALEVTALVALTASAILATFVSPATSIALLSYSRYIVVIFDMTPELYQLFHLVLHKVGPKNQEIPFESLLDKIPNPKDRSEALQLLFLSEQEASDPAIVREHYMLLMTKFTFRLRKNTSPIFRPWLSTMINYGKESYRTLGGDPKENDGNSYTDPD